MRVTLSPSTMSRSSRARSTTSVASRTQGAQRHLVVGDRRQADDELAPEPVELRPRRAERLRDEGEVPDARLLVVEAAGEDLGRALALVDGAGDGLPLPVEGADAVVDDDGEVVGVERLEQLGELAEDVLELDDPRRVVDGAALGDERALVDGAVEVDLDLLLAEQRLPGRRERRALGDREVRFEHELGDGAQVVGERDRADLADVHAADLHVGALHDTLPELAEHDVHPVVVVVGTEGVLRPEVAEGEQEHEADRPCGALRGRRHPVHRGYPAIWTVLPSP
jgi:hypothetical protein